MKPFYTLSGNDVLERLGVEREKGLDQSEVKKRRLQFGANLLPQQEKKSLTGILFDQFRSLIFLLLGLAAALSFAFQNWAEGAAILVVIVINTAIGFFTELKGLRSMEGLRQLIIVQVKVRREGKVSVIPASELVPGDIILFEAGDVFGADMRLLEAFKLQVDESVLTGESLPISKHIDPTLAKTPLPDRTNMAYQGTGITLGSGEGVVVATAMETELGKIASLVSEAKEVVTPLQKRLEGLSRQLVWVTLILAGIVGIAGIVTGTPIFLMVQTAIALAVAAVPEGLPMVATLALARGMWRMARKNALIERLPAVETLGSTTVILVDKTGTLTENLMTATHLALPSGDFSVVPKANLKRADFMKGDTSIKPKEDHVLQKFLDAGVLCNNASLESTRPGQEGFQTVGDPIDEALLVLGAWAGIYRENLVETWPEIQVEAFDPELKMMATAHAADGGYLIAVKGAPEEILEKASHIQGANGPRALTARERKKWLAKNAELAGLGLRVLGIAEKVTPKPEKEIYQGLTFLGLVGFLDPPRADVAGAIKACNEAGMRVVMVTGDHAVTARYIALAIGLAKKSDPPPLEGKDIGQLKDLSAKELEYLLKIPVFARVSPRQKLDLIALYQGKGNVVAMTGDGVNDAPALRKADIGIAMGRRGSQVARQASDIILRDDAFSTIVAAIEQGRVIFGNIRKFIVYLLSCNLSEIMVVGLAFLGGLPLPLLPLQILYLNLVTDVFPAFALGLGEGEKGIMKKPPRDPKERLLPKSSWAVVGVYGTVMTATVLSAFVVALYVLELEPERAVTVSFLTLAFAQLWHVFNMRAQKSGFIKNEITRNRFVWAALLLCSGLLMAAIYIPVLSQILGLTQPDQSGWLTALGFSLVPLVFGQTKMFFRKTAERNT